MIRNVARFFMFSNETKAPIALEEGDRRFFIVECEQAPKDQTYYERFYELMKDPKQVAGVWRWLMARDLGGYDPKRRPPMTDAKQRVIDNSKHPVKALVKDATETGLVFDWLRSKGLMAAKFMVDGRQGVPMTTLRDWLNGPGQKSSEREFSAALSGRVGEDQDASAWGRG